MFLPYFSLSLGFRAPIGPFPTGLYYADSNEWLERNKILWTAQRKRRQAALAATAATAAADAADAAGPGPAPLLVGPQFATLDDKYAADPEGARRAMTMAVSDAPRQTVSRDLRFVLYTRDRDTHTLAPPARPAKP